jgi:mannosyltransferase OCH1-like enzyme
MGFNRVFKILDRLYKYLFGFIWYNTWKGFYTEPKTADKFTIQSNVKQEHDIFNYEQKIPKIIHQTHEFNLLLKDRYLSSQILINMNPEYEYKFYNTSERRQYILKHFDNKVVQAYDKLNHGAFKADLFRYCVLYKEGGIYIDCKSYPYEPFRKFVLRDSTFSIFMDTTNHRPQNGFIMCTPNNTIMLNTINLAVENILASRYGVNPLDIAGPEILAKIINKAIKKEDHFAPYQIKRYITNENTFVDVIGKCSTMAIYFCNKDMIPLVSREYKGYLTFWDIWRRYEIMWILGTIYTE